MCVLDVTVNDDWLRQEQFNAGLDATIAFWCLYCTSGFVFFIYILCSSVEVLSCCCVVGTFVPRTAPVGASLVFV